MIKFLIIEDEDAIRMVIRKILQKNFSCTIQEAGNGKQGLDILQNDIPDLILLDINMPVMDGKETLEILKSHSLFQKIPVVIMTALGDKETVGTFLKKGIADYLLKPLEQVETVKRINKVIENHSKAAKSTSEKNPIEGGFPRLLLVEENITLIEEFNSTFHDKFILITAKNGIDTLEKFNQYHPRYIVISDKIGLLDKKIIIQRIRELVDQSQASIFIIIDDMLAQSVKIFNFDGVIRRNTDRTQFKRDLLKVVLKEDYTSEPVNENNN